MCRKRNAPPPLSSWKEQVDIYSRAAEQQRLTTERIEAEKRHNAELKDYKDRLEIFKQKFKCHINGCTVIATKPVSGMATDYPTRDNESFKPYHYPYINWDEPSDLYLCTRCNQWTCKKHIHSGICIECWSKATGLKF
jgi:hypothetical protein